MMLQKWELNVKDYKKNVSEEMSESLEQVQTSIPLPSPRRRVSKRRKLNNSTISALSITSTTTQHIQNGAGMDDANVKNEIQEAGGKSLDKKAVVFCLHKNMAIEMDILDNQISHGIKIGRNAFDPQAHPKQGILRSPPKTEKNMASFPSITFPAVGTVLGFGRVQRGRGKITKRKVAQDFF